MDKAAIEALGKMALGKLSEATEKAYRGEPNDPAAREALSLLAALCEALRRPDKGADTTIRPLKELDLSIRTLKELDLSIRPLKELDLSIRTFNLLTQAGYQTAQQVENAEVPVLLRIPGLGRGSIGEIDYVFERAGQPRDPQWGWYRRSFERSKTGKAMLSAIDEKEG